MKRRFWEQDEQIYGGHSYTTQSISEIAYPSYGYFKKGPAVLLGAYAGGAAAYQYAAMTPEQRIETALAQGSVFHKQYRQEFSNGTAVVVDQAALDPGLRFELDRRTPPGSLSEPRLGRWPHRAGGRALLLYRRLDGGGIAVVDRRHHAPSPAGACRMTGAARLRRARAVATGLAILALAGASATISAQQTGDTAGTGSAKISTASGEQTYKEICAACHMANAEGARGAAPALAANPHLADADFALNRVLRGQGGMPAFNDMLSADQVAGVVTYVRTISATTTRRR